jgi:hypothetical protein
VREVLERLLSRRVVVGARLQHVLGHAQPLHAVQQRHPQPSLAAGVGALSGDAAEGGAGQRGLDAQGVAVVAEGAVHGASPVWS